jgi:lysophospholipase L1-like esterase
VGVRRRSGRVVGAALGLGAVLVFLGLAPPVAGASDPPYYVAVGGSGSLGLQPTADHPHGRPTDAGYSDDLLATERSAWPDLRLVKFGCPGITTTAMLDGDDHRCHYAFGSQLADVVDFLHHHPSTVLMTIDLGFNDVTRCMEHERIDDACVDGALDTVHDQLTRITDTLRSAGEGDMHVVGVGHYDPYLGSYFDGPAGRAFADQSLDVLARLNRIMRAAYATAGVPMADVSAAFETTDTDATALDQRGPVPRDVARICALTWMCAPAPYGPNVHPNDSGYSIISRAIVNSLHH